MSSEYEFDGAYELISPIWQRSFFRVDADVNKCLIIQSSDVETATARSATMYYNKYQDEYSEPLQWFGLNGTGSSPYFQYTLMAVKKSAYAAQAQHRVSLQNTLLKASRFKEWKKLGLCPVLTETPTQTTACLEMHGTSTRIPTLSTR